MPISAGAAGLVLSAGWLLRRLASNPVVPTWPISQLWVSYRDGFVRRGLPGELLSWVVGGEATGGQATVAALTLTAAGLGAFVWLTAVTWRRSVDGGTWWAMAALCGSPFTFALVARDVGRYDAVGSLALAAIAAVASRGTVPIAIVGSVAAAVSVLSQEFLVLLVVPVAVLALIRAGGSRRLALLVAAPGLIAALASALMRPDRAELARAVAIAHNARPDIPADGAATAIAAIGQDTSHAVSNLATMSWWVLPTFSVLLGACYAASLAALWLALGRPGGTVRWLWLAGFPAVAMVLSVAGVDYRRWWALAFVAAAAAMVIVAESAGRALPRPSLLSWAAVVAASLVLLAVQFAPISAKAPDPPGASVFTIDTVR